MKMEIEGTWQSRRKTGEVVSNGIWRVLAMGQNMEAEDQKGMTNPGLAENDN